MKKIAWYLAGMLVLTLASFVVSCGGTPATTTPATTTPTTTPTTAPTTPTATTPTTTPTTPATTVAAGPPKIPHTLEGRTDCVVCHKDGITAPKVSTGATNHAAFTSAVCAGCHSGAIPNAPKITEAHSTRTATDCLTCHKDGIKAPKFPASHASYTKEMCQGCHTTS